MSIYKQNIDPIALTESDADEFLRDMDITLYEDTMVIEGTEFEGTYGEEILAENGIFLYEDGIVLEGKQAEEYKARKAKEKAAAEKAKDDELKFDSDNNKYMYGTKIGSKYPLLKVSSKDYRGDLRRMDTAKNIADKACRDYLDKYDKDNNPNHLRSYVNVDTIASHRSIMRNLKNQDRIAKSKKSTVQHNSTIFSDIDII